MNCGKDRRKPDRQPDRQRTRMANQHVAGGSRTKNPSSWRDGLSPSYGPRGLGIPRAACSMKLALDKIGEYGPDNRGKLSWTEGYKLSRAIDRVKYLDGDDAGWAIDEIVVDGWKYLQAVRARGNVFREFCMSIK